MAGFDSLLTQDSITAYAKTVFTNTDIFEDGLTDDELNARNLPAMQLKPYVVLRYGAMRPSATGKAFGGQRWDDYFATVDVDCTAPTGRMARAMLAAWTDSLVGWTPTDSNRIYMQGSVYNYATEANAAGPSTFTCSARFLYGLNVTGVSLPIPH